MKIVPEVLFIADFWPEAPALFVQLEQDMVWDERLRARKTASFGVPYNYGRMSLTFRYVLGVPPGMPERSQGSV